MERKKQNKKSIKIDFSMNWETLAAYLMVCIETHAKKSFFAKQNGESARDVIKENITHVARLADQLINEKKRELESK